MSLLVDQCDFIIFIILLVLIDLILGLISFDLNLIYWIAYNKIN